MTDTPNNADDADEDSVHDRDGRTDPNGFDAPSDASSIRQTVHYSGRVQGVGFRATAARVANRFAVEGFVRNLSDGRVELVAEGTPEEVDLFLGSLAATMSAYIRNQSRRQTLATGEFRRFFIKRTAI